MADIQYARMVQKSATGVPTIPPSPTHDNGDWDLNDIYEFELYFDTLTGNLYTRISTSVIQLNQTGGLMVVNTDGSMQGAGTVASPLGVKLSAVLGNLLTFDGSGAIFVGSDSSKYDATNPSGFQTAAQVASAASGKENIITAGTTAQYWRGDKTFQVLNKAAVGLSNVDNTADSAKPVSTAQATAIGFKEDTSNKGSNITGNEASLTLFPNMRAVVDWVSALFSKRQTALTITGNTTLTSWDQLVLINITANTAITLPVCNGNVGKTLSFKRVDANAVNVTFLPNAADTTEVSINTLGFQRSCVTVQVSGNTSSVQVSESSEVRGANVVRLTSSGTYVPSRNDVKYATVEGVGGGAGGGGSAAGSATLVGIGANGGAGGYAKVLLTTAQLVAPIPYTIGAAGAAGTSNTVAPTAGGATLFGTAGAIFTANGGGTGITAPAPQTVSAVIQGGVGGGFTIATGVDAGSSKGENGRASRIDIISTRMNAFALGGGSSRLGCGGVSPSKSTLTTAANIQTGVAATQFGSGGSGGYSGGTGATAVSGGAGTPGIIIVTEYFD